MVEKRASPPSRSNFDTTDWLVHVEADRPVGDRQRVVKEVGNEAPVGRGVLFTDLSVPPPRSQELARLARRVATWCGASGGTVGVPLPRATARSKGASAVRWWDDLRTGMIRGNPTDREA